MLKLMPWWATQFRQRIPGGMRPTHRRGAPYHTWSTSLGYESAQEPKIGKYARKGLRRDSTFAIGFEIVENRLQEILKVLIGCCGDLHRLRALRLVLLHIPNTPADISLILTSSPLTEVTSSCTQT